MLTDANETTLRIPSYVGLEQAMEEVRSYLGGRNSASPSPTLSDPGKILRPGGVRQQQFSGQATHIARLSEINARMGEVEPNSKLGAPGVFLKRVVRKTIGFYSRPVHQFDGGVIEALQQLRHDMLGLQQQITALDQKIGSGSAMAASAEPVETPPPSLPDL